MSAKRKVRMSKFDVIGYAIYSYGLSPEAFEAEFGEPLLEWETDAPVDTNPGELTQADRQEYRRQARAAVAAIPAAEKVKASGELKCAMEAIESAKRKLLRQHNRGNFYRAQLAALAVKR